MIDPAVEHGIAVFKYALLAGPAVGIAIVVWRKRLLLGIGIGALVIGCAGLYGGGSVALQRYLALAGTASVEGRLVTYISTPESRIGGRSTVSRVPVVAYTTADGQTRQFKGLGGSAADLATGDAVAVRYRTDRPDEAQVDDFQSTWGIVIAFGAFALLPTLIGLFFTRMALRFRTGVSFRASR